MPLPFLAGPTMYQRFVVLTGPGDNTVTIPEMGFTLTDGSEYVVWSEFFGSDLTLKHASKTEAQFVVTATAVLNTKTVDIWVIPVGGKMRTVI